MKQREMAEELFTCMGLLQRGPIGKVQEISQGEMAMLGSFILTGRTRRPQSCPAVFISPLRGSPIR